MNTTVLARPADLDARAAIGGWGVPVDPDVAVLLASDLVTNAIRHGTSQSVTLGVRCARGRLQVDVQEAGPGRAPRPAAAAGPLAWPGLVLAAVLSGEWGCYRTAAGAAGYFSLAFRPGLAAAGCRLGGMP
jgi:hypothetical protein